MSLHGAVDAICVDGQLFVGAMHTQCGGIPSSRHGLGPMFLLEGGARLSGHGAGEQMLLLVCAFWQESCPPGLLLSSLGLTPQKDHGNRSPSLPQQYLPKQKGEAEGPPR